MTEFNEEAVNWINGINDADGVSAGWRLEILSKKFRKPRKEGEEAKEVPMRIRRFVRGLPWALVHDAIRYLISKAPYTGIIYNGVPIDGTYRPTLTRWVRDDQERVNGNAFGSYTLIQDLIEDEFVDEFSTTTSGNCTEETLTTWRWDEPSIEDITSLEGYGEQGITYSIQAVRRTEDDLFEYAIVKRIAKTHHTGPIEVECNELSKTTVETWDNVYGNEDEGFKDDTGVSISGIPPACQNDPGVTVQFSTRQNQDCTYQLQLTRKEVFEHSVEWTDGTACQKRDVTVITNAKTRPEEPVPDAGETVDAQISRNEDMSYNARFAVTRAMERDPLTWEDGTECRKRNVIHITQSPTVPELPKISKGQTLNIDLRPNANCTYDATFTITDNAKEKKIEWKDGSKCRKRSVTSYQNFEEQPKPPEPSRAGETVNATIRQNDDCTYDAQFSITEPPQASKLDWDDGTMCKPRHNVSLQNATVEPSIPKPLSPGETISGSIRMNDDCTYDAQYSTVISKADQEEWVDGTPCKLRTNSVFFNQKTPKKPNNLSPGQTTSGSVRRNDDGTYDCQISVTKSSSGVAAWNDGSSVKPRSNVALFNQPSYSVPGPSGAGSVVSGSIRMNDDCTYDVQYSTTTSIASQTTWNEGTGCKPRTTTAYFNQPSPPTSMGSPSSGQTISGSVRMNDDGTYDSQFSTTTATEQSVSWDDGSVTKSRHNVANFNTTSANIPSSAAAGTVVSGSIRMNDDCTYDVQYSTTTSNADSISWSDGSGCSAVSHILSINQKSVSSSPATSGGYTSTSVSANDDGTYDVHTESYTQVPFSTGWVTWNSEQKSPGGRTAKYEHGFIKVGGCTSANEVINAIKLNGHNLSMDVSYDPRTCTYSGSAQYSDLVSWTDPPKDSTGTGTGSEGKIQTGTAHFVIIKDKPVLLSDGDDDCMTVKKKWRADSIMFFGTGNEGTEADAAVNAYYVSGLKLPPRMYLRSEPTLER